MGVLDVFFLLNSLMPWYKWPLIVSILYLVATRRHLYSNNLHDMYAQGESAPLCSADQAHSNLGECIGDVPHEHEHAVDRYSHPDQSSPINCTPKAQWSGARARTADGTCNHVEQPEMGARFYRMGRNIGPEQVAKALRKFDLMDPNPRLVARTLLRRSEFVPATTLNYLAAAWIQFQVHDWFHHGENEVDAPHHVLLDKDDPLHDETNDGRWPVKRTRVDRTRRTKDGEGELGLTYTNNCTHWWDGSQLYGSSLHVENKLRSFQDGKMKVDKDGLLLFDEDDIEVTGFNDNWWTGLSLFHNLFTKEHNTICDMLKKNHPDFNDQRLFETARLINSALIAKIHTIEWTPALLASTVLKVAMNANWYGLLGANFKRIFGHIGSPVLSGIIGAERELAGVSYSMTEEFTSVYRMHPLIRDGLEIRSVESGETVEEVSLFDLTFERNRRLRSTYSQEDLFYSFGSQHPGALVLHNYPRTLMDITKPDGTRIDLATIDILRDRERHVPRYNHFRRSINLKPLTSIDEITPDPELRKELKEMYNNDIEKVDLLVGSLAENPRPTNFAFAETSFQIFIVMASRRLHGDRFYTDDYTEEYYTKEGLEWVDNANLRMVLLRHYPRLKPALDTVPVDNGFMAWKLPGQKGTQCSSNADCNAGLKCKWTGWFSYTCA